MEKQNLRAANYTVSIEIEKSSNEVFSRVINDVSQYWPEDFEGNSAQLNDEFIFRSGDTHYSKNKIAEFVAGERVVWLVTDSIRKTDNFEWTGTKMIFELASSGENTLLKFTYDGFIQENEYDRLVRVCDMIIKETLYGLITNGKVK